MTDYYTEDLSQFGMREIEMLRDTLTAWLNNGLPEGFDQEGVKPAMNKGSGYVFLVNEDYQVAMEADGKLELWHTTPYDGHEGFLADLLELSPEKLSEDDIEYIVGFAKEEGLDLPESWQKLVHDEDSRFSHES